MWFEVKGLVGSIARNNGELSRFHRIISVDREDVLAEARKISVFDREEHALKRALLLALSKLYPNSSIVLHEVIPSSEAAYRYQKAAKTNGKVQ